MWCWNVLFVRRLGKYVYLVVEGRSELGRQIERRRGMDGLRAFRCLFFYCVTRSFVPCYIVRRIASSRSSGPREEGKER
jgi:hypothetical protein